MPDVTIEDPVTHTRYIYSGDKELTPDIVRRIIEAGRKIDPKWLAAAAPAPGKSTLWTTPDGRKVTGELLPDDGGALERYGKARSGALSALAPSDGSAIEKLVDKVGDWTRGDLPPAVLDLVAGWFGSDGPSAQKEIDHWRSSARRQVVGALSLPGEVLGFGAGVVPEPAQGRGVDFPRLAARAAQKVVPFAPELEQGAASLLPPAGGLDIAGGAGALRASLSHLWESDPVGFLGQGAALAGMGLGVARGAAMRSLAPETLRFRGGADLKRVSDLPEAGPGALERAPYPPPPEMPLVYDPEKSRVHSAPTLRSSRCACSGGGEIPGYRLSAHFPVSSSGSCSPY